MTNFSSPPSTQFGPKPTSLNIYLLATCHASTYSSFWTAFICFGGVAFAMELIFSSCKPHHKHTQGTTRAKTPAKKKEQLGSREGKLDMIISEPFISKRFCYRLYYEKFHYESELLLVEQRQKKDHRNMWLCPAKPMYRRLLIFLWFIHSFH